MYRRIVALILGIVLVAVPLTGTATAGSTHWAAAALQYAVETGMLPADDLRGADNATRAELASMVTQLLGLETAAPLTGFPDVPAGHPHAEALSRAVALGLLKGIDGKLCPDEPVTREQAFVILARAFALPEGNIISLSRFTDGGQVGSWAAAATAGLVQQGLVQGSDGLLRPGDPISRQELAQLLLNLTQRVCDGAGGTAIVPAGCMPPAEALIEGDLYLCCDAGSSVELKQVTVTGRLVIRGSGEVTLTASSAGSVVLCDDGVTFHTGGADVAIEARAAATITGGAASVTSGAAVTLKDGSYAALTVEAGTMTVDGSATVTEALLCGTGTALVGDGTAETVTLTKPDCAVLLKTGTLVEAIDYGLRNVTASLTVTAEPVPDAPTLRAKLTLHNPTPLPEGRAQNLRVCWAIGGTELSAQTVSLVENAVAELAAPIDYSQPLPEGKLTVTVTLAEERMQKECDVNLHAELARPHIETIQVQATVHTGTGLFADYLLTQYIGWVNAGTSGIYTNYCTDLSAQLELEDGRSGWVQCTSITISQDNYVRAEDYTVQEKENYVNLSGYTSATDYLVWVSLKCQRVNVFLRGDGGWKLIESFTVATGKNSTPTIAGVFAYSYRVERWDFGEYYVTPVLIFNGGHAFHSRTYTPRGTLLDATLGYPVSAGCVRMRDEDVGWLDQYLPLHSTVVVY